MMHATVASMLARWTRTKKKTKAMVRKWWAQMQLRSLRYRWWRRYHARMRRVQRAARVQQMQLQ
jgi:hypothetical protein